MKILHIADWQIESFSKINRKSEYIDSSKRLNQIILNEKPDFLVIVGDIFETYNPSEDDRSIFMDFIVSIPKNIQIIITNGNHDLQLKGDNFFLLGDDVKIPKEDVLETVTKNMDDNVHYINKTCFYTVGDITFAVWNHKDKIHSNNFNPWLLDKIPETNNTIIDLFHDPVKNCVDFEEKTVRGNNENRVDTSEFKGSIFLMGDIHKPQIFKNSKNIGAYSSSLVARNFGEGVKFNNDIKFYDATQFHGYNIVDTNEKTITFNRMDSDYEFITLYVDNDFNGIELQEDKKYYLKVVYKLWSAELQNKISDLLDKYNILYFVDDKTNIILDDISSDNSMDLKDILDKDNLKTILLERLKSDNLKLGEEGINRCINLFNHLWNITDTTTKKKLVEIRNISCSNFRGLGDITYTLENGVIKLNAENGVGKTTLSQILPTALFLLNTYNNSRGKRKQNLLSFFNDRSQKDKTVISVIFHVEGVEYSLERIIERVWKKNKKDGLVTNWVNNITSVNLTSTLKGGKINTTDEDAIANFICGSFGEYEDYSLISEVNSYNLFEFINLSSENLIDSILKLVGIDKIERMNEAVKEMDSNYKESKTIYKIVESDAVQEINTIKIDIENVLLENITIQNSIMENEKEIDNTNQKITEEVKKITHVDESVINSENTLKNNLIKLNENIVEINYKIENYDKIHAEITTNNGVISLKENNVEKIKNNVEKIKNNLSIKENEIDNKRTQLKNSEDTFLNEKNSIKTTLESEILDLKYLDSEKVEVHNKDLIKDLTVKNTSLNKLNTELGIVNNMLSEKKSFECNICGLDITNISKVQEEIQVLEDKKTKLEASINVLSDDINILEGKKLSIGSFFNEEIEKLKDKLNNNSLRTFDKTNELKEIEILINEIPSIKQTLSEIISKLTKEEIEIKNLYGENERLNKSIVDDIITLTNEKTNIEEKITTINQNLGEIEKLKIILEKNKVYKATIETLTKKVSLTKKEGQSLKTSLNEVNIKLIRLKETLSTKEDILSKYRKQVEDLMIFNIFKKLTSKKELPIDIFRKMTSMINHNINKKLKDVPFSVYFNTEEKIPNLYFMDYTKNISRSIKECSGMEKAFSVMALKNQIFELASMRTDFVVMDEISANLKFPFTDYMVSFINEFAKDKKVILVDNLLDVEKFENLKEVSLVKNEEFAIIK